jgi:hypothetical protein
MVEIYHHSPYVFMAWSAIKHRETLPDNLYVQCLFITYFFLYIYVYLLPTQALSSHLFMYSYLLVIYLFLIIAYLFVSIYKYLLLYFLFNIHLFVT